MNQRERDAIITWTWIIVLFTICWIVQHFHLIR